MREKTLISSPKDMTLKTSSSPTRNRRLSELVHEKIIPSELFCEREEDF